jgi:fused signal recognition particle receptor
MPVNRLFRRSGERKTLWKKVVDLALTDVRVAVGGMDHETLETLEEKLIAADFGVDATMRLVDRVEDQARRGKVRKGADLRRALEDEVRTIFQEDAGDPGLQFADSGPTVFLVVGVNGVGKTTTIGKLAHHLRSEGMSVLVGAADTYRAGAVAQLEKWAERVGAEFVGGQKGGDPAAVAFDAIEAAENRGIDVVIVDTAGRLHTRNDLMQELQKVDRVIRRKLGRAPHETLVVLDGTVGQNGIAQLREFGKVVEPTGLILTKMDSTARGGIVVALQQEFGIPVKLVGLGEGVADLDGFDVDAFLEGVFEDG